MYKIIETSNGENKTIAEYESYDEANSKFEDRVVAFLDGTNEEPNNMYRRTAYFWFEFKDGEEYTLELIEECEIEL